ncbi:MAG: hypothetical protein EOP24_38060 [Hyphomicrobiales bacterium]|nr:MAG: hypothetical protein EOP24_38060 [Hyphomicrobiales bacterium]
MPATVTILVLSGLVCSRCFPTLPNASRTPLYTGLARRAPAGASHRLAVRDTKKSVVEVTKELKTFKTLWRSPMTLAQKSRGAKPSRADAMLDFARIWAPYGGARAEDIFVEFGIGRAAFYRHVEKRLRSRTPTQIADEERRQLTYQVVSYTAPRRQTACSGSRP